MNLICSHCSTINKVAGCFISEKRTEGKDNVKVYCWKCGKSWEPSIKHVAPPDPYPGDAPADIAPAQLDDEIVKARKRLADLEARKAVATT